MKSLKNAILSVAGVLSLAGCTGAPPSDWHYTSYYDRPAFVPGKGLAGPYDVYEWSYGRPSDFEDYVGKMPVGYRNEAMMAEPDFSYDENAMMMPAPQMSYTPPKLPQTLLQPRVDHGDVSVYSIPGDNSDITSLMTGTPEEQLYFNYGSARIGSGDRQKIKRVARKAGGSSVSVVGHASKRVDGVSDPTVKKEINYQMGQQRAEAVSNVLAQEGVPSSSINAVSRGQEEPNPHPGHRGQEPADRRVDIYVTN